MKFIDIDDVREDILGVISLKGDNYEYTPPDGNSCVYIHNGQPSCMIGYYLVEKGVSQDILWANNAEPISKLISNKVLPEFLFSKDAVSALVDLQDYQDSGHTWGTAFNLTFEPEDL